MWQDRTRTRCGFRAIAVTVAYEHMGEFAHEESPFLDGIEIASVR